MDKLEEKMGYENTNMIGDLPTKFHYTKVKENSNLTDEMLLYLDEKTLNKLIPVKTIVPYRDQEFKINNFTLTKEMRNIRRDIERKKAKINEEIKEEEKIRENNLQMLGKKKKKTETKNDKNIANDFKDPNNNIDKSRLASYLNNSKN